MSDERAPREPSELAIWLSQNTIGQVHVTSKMTGVDTRQTYLTLYPVKAFGEIIPGASRTFDKESVMRLVDVQIDWVAIMRLKREEAQAVDAWVAFKKRNQKEFTEYQRLARKFGNAKVSP